MTKSKHIKRFSEITIKDVPLVGGKNASLGEMIRSLKPKGIIIPDGFATTAEAFRYFLKENKLDVLIKNELGKFDNKNLKTLRKKGKKIRQAILKAKLPKDLEEEIAKHYKILELEYGNNLSVAVRSSATAEDLPGASFAGQQETYLNVQGVNNVIIAVKKSFASLFTDRAISYRHDKGFDQTSVSLSSGVQKMVRSDKSCSGIMFTLDTESGFKNSILINGALGLGEMIVQGEVIPDEFLVYKPFLDKSGVTPIISKRLGKKARKMIYASGGGKTTKVINTSEKERNKFVLSEREIVKLAKWGAVIENHYSKIHNRWSPMDIEWAKDGISGELFIVQARPETVQAMKNFSKVVSYKRLESGKKLISGMSVGSKVATGKAHIILDAKKIDEFKKGEVLVTDMTDPDWEPIMKIASAIVTDKGGRTSHAAIVARELGIPAIVGSENATKILKDGKEITVDTTGSDGFVFEGKLKFSKKVDVVNKIKKPKVKIMMNIGTPEIAFEKSFLPNDGVGLAREEFIIASEIGIHPMALIQYRDLKSYAYGKGKNKWDKEFNKNEAKKIVDAIDKKTAGYEDKVQYYIDKLAYGLGTIAAAFYPKQVIVRFSDFKTNEYRQLVGGGLYEPEEENPMLGWRGASRYYNPGFEKAFSLEVKSIKKVREIMGLDNVNVMVPFCRTPEEGIKVKKLIDKYGLKKSSGLKIYVMCEIPSNILLADEFLKVFDGMSIGSNDLTQMVLGIDRDGGKNVHSIANETNQAVKEMVSKAIYECRKRNKYIGICGQAPSDHLEFAKFLIKEGIESISLNPDSVIKTTTKVSSIKPKKIK